MVEVVPSVCFPKSIPYLTWKFDEFREYDPTISEDSLFECTSFVYDISYPVSLFLRLYVLECECPCGGLSW